MMDAFGVERSEVSKAISPNQMKALSNIAGTKGAGAKYATEKLSAAAAGKKSAARSPAQTARWGNVSRKGQKAATNSRSALANVAKEPRAGSIGSMEASAAKAIKNNRPRSQKVLQAVGSGSRAAGTRVRAVGSSVGSGTARAGRAVGSGTARAARAVGSGTARAGRSVRASMTRTPRAAAPTTAAAPTVTAAPAAATGTEAGTTTVKNKSRFKRNAALVGGGALAGAGGMAYNIDRNNQMMSKSAFGVTHEVSKAERVAGVNDRWVFSDGEYNARRDQMKRNKGIYAGAGAAGASSIGLAAYATKNTKNTNKHRKVSSLSRGKKAAIAAVPAALATTGLVHYADVKEAQAANKWRESQGLSRRNPITGLARVSKSAFGVDHEVSKAALPTFAGLGNKVGQAANAGLTKFPKMNAGMTGKLRQVSAAASRNPTQMGQRTAAGLGVAGTAGVGAAGAYGMNKKNRY